jgi:carbon dioxide concentrating mechanism protein CcmM
MQIKTFKNLILATFLTIVLTTSAFNQVFLKTSPSLSASAQPSTQPPHLIITNSSINSNNASLSNSVNIRPNIQTDYNPTITYPKISATAFIDPFAVVIGDCEIGKLVMVAPFAVCRGDEGTPIHLGDYSNLQDGGILHALETTSHGNNIDDRRYSSDGTILKANDTNFKNGFAIFVGDKVSLAHDVQIHGPAFIGNDTFVGMNTLIFNAKIGQRVAIGVSSTITNGVTIADDKFVPPGSVISTQAQADALPKRIGSPYATINNGVLHVNQELAKGYDQQTILRLATEIEDLLEQEEMLQTGSPTGNPHTTLNNSISFIR